MKFSWKWLNKLTDLKDINIEKAIATLTLSGFEVDYIEYKKEINDTVLNINIPTNRHDTCSMIGLARELSILFNRELKISVQYNYQIKKPLVNNIIKVESKIFENLEINIINLVKKNTSPLWLKNYLIACDIKPCHILKDILNYIILKWGYNIEIFDLGKITTQAIDPSLIKIEKINQRKEIIRNLLIDSNNDKISILEILKYEESIISIFGLKSNKKFYYDDQSHKLMLIGYICNNEYMQETKILQGHNTMQTVASDLLSAYNETIELMLHLNQGHTISSYIYNQIKYKPYIINIKQENISHTLGPLKNAHILKHKDICHILKQLKFKYRHENNDFRVEIPEYRKSDITRGIDVIEEIARVYGFNQFIDILPDKTRNGHVSNVNKIIKKIRYILRDLGLHEIIQYSLEKWNQQDKSTIRIYNPLLEDQNKLKQCLVKELVDTHLYNIKQKNWPLECFEIGKTFSYDNHQLYNEKIHLAGIMGNDQFSRKSWSEKKEELTWFQAKGLMEEFFEKLGATISWNKPTKHLNWGIDESYYNLCHPHRTAILYNKHKNKEIGVFSQLNSTISKKICKSYNSYIFEINIHALIECIIDKKHLQYYTKPYSMYPCITRDISLKLPKKESIEFIQNKIIQGMHPLIESVEVFDEYKKTNRQIEDRYVGFRIIYRSNTRTLNDQDIEFINKAIDELLRNTL